MYEYKQLQDIPVHAEPNPFSRSMETLPAALSTPLLLPCVEPVRDEAPADADERFLGHHLLAYKRMRAGYAIIQSMDQCECIPVRCAGPH